MCKWGVNYWETYAPVVNCISVRSILAIVSKHEFPTRSIDFVIAFSQVDLDVDVFIDPPLRMIVDRKRGEWVLKLNKSLYGIKQESKKWFDLLKPALKRRGYHKFQVYPCVFYRKYSVILTYVDDSVIANFVLTDEVDI